MNNEPVGYAGLKERFAKPPAEYRSLPFWSWNGTLDQGELDAQVEGFKEQGMGGFMMHVREGLETPYMGEAFMARIRDTVAKAKAEGLYAWLYDEDRYSSGMGGGMVPRIGGDAVRAKALSLTVCHRFERDDSILAVYRATIDRDDLLDCERLDDVLRTERPMLRGQDVYLVMRRHIAAPNEWCHGDTYPDAMNPEAGRLFLETTYERYKEAVGEEFGQTVPGIFTDEPSISGFRERLDEPEMTWIAWSDLLPQTFMDKNGYELWDTLPYFFYRGAASSKIRHDYWKTVTEMFCEAYSKQIGDWCRANGIAFAGHFCDEGDLIGAVRNGGAVMPHYRYLDIPGIDTLSEQTDESLTIKQVSSVANQYGKRRVITETYGVTGWALTFESRKWIGDWQFVLGVNVLTHHLALYSLRGCRKRDYPPSFNYNANWWTYNHVMEHYYARLGAVLSEGRVARDVLVIHPSTSVWAMLGKDVQAAEWRNEAGSTEELRAYNEAFNGFVRELLGEHYDFDLGDELILQEIGRVDGARLAVGEASYRVVVLPDLRNLLRSTFALLLAYMNAGGSVLAFGRVPVWMDGEPADELQALVGHPRFKRLVSRGRLMAELGEVVPRSVSLTDRDGREAGRLLYMRRELPDCTVVFVVNNDREAAYDVDVRIAGNGRVEEWCALTGEMTAITARTEEGYAVFRERFGPADSRLYVITPYKGQTHAGVTRPLTVERQRLTDLGQVASFTRTAPNALVLDVCQYRLADEDWSEAMSVWEAQKHIRERLGMRQVYFNGNLQRYLWIHEPHANDGASVAFRFVFEVKDIPATDTFFVFEQAERFRFTLNGEPLSERPQGWYMDRSMSTVRLPALLEGENVLEVHGEYRQDMELEDAFLIGDFAMDPGRSLIREPETLHFGDWCGQGYPHYCGSMIYHFELEAEWDAQDGSRIMLELGPYEAVTLHLQVNGEHERAIPWRAAGTVDITDWLVPGTNRIDIEVVGSPRNLFGPLHEARPNPAWVDWWSFRPTGPDYTPEYRLQPYGLMGPLPIFRAAPRTT